MITAGDDACSVASYLMRPDSEPDLAEVIAAWSGACPADGTCVTGCNDPDAIRARSRARAASPVRVVDLDCPLGGLAGETCAVADDCESRVCAGDELRPVSARHRARPTPTARRRSTRASPVRARTRRQTPGIAGAACTPTPIVDRSCAIVDAQICTIPCGANDACPATVSCEPVRDTRACTSGWLRDRRW